MKSQNTRFVFSLLLVLWLSGLASGDDRPNIVLIMADDEYHLPFGGSAKTRENAKNNA